MLNRIPYCINIFFQNPKIFFKKVLGRILARIVPSPKEVTQVKIGGYTLDMFPYRNYWWKSMYLGYCDVEISHNIRKCLNKEGIFVDVGAGVGYFSAIASDIVGAAGQVHCFEPFPSNVEMIKRMIKSNPNSNIILNDCALGADNHVHDYYMNQTIRGWECSMIQNSLERIDKVIRVSTRRLDAYLEEKNIDDVSLIKIDVEGYEYYVLKGLTGFFKKTTHRPPIICEIYMPAYKKLKISLNKFDAYMKECGYRTCNIFNPRIKIGLRSLRETTDVIFMPVK